MGGQYLKVAHCGRDRSSNHPKVGAIPASAILIERTEREEEKMNVYFPRPSRPQPPMKGWSDKVMERKTV